MNRKLKGTEKQIKSAEDLLNKLDKYINFVKESFKGDEADEELEEFKEMLVENEKYKKIKSNTKASEVIYTLESFCKNDLWHLEDEAFVKSEIEKQGGDESYGKYVAALTVEDVIRNFLD